MKKLLILLFLLSSAAAFGAASDDSDIFKSSLELYNQAVKDRDFEDIFAHHEVLRRFDLKSAYQESQNDKSLLKLIADTKPDEYAFLSRILDLFQPQSPIYTAVRNQNWQSLKEEINGLEQQRNSTHVCNQKSLVQILIGALHTHPIIPHTRIKPVDESDEELEQIKVEEQITWNPWANDTRLATQCARVLARHQRHVLAALPTLHAAGEASTARSLLPALCINEALVKRIGMQSTMHKINAIIGPAFSSDGNTFATSSKQDTLDLWDAKTFKHIKTLPLGDGYINSMFFSSNGDIHTAALKDRFKIILQNVRTGERKILYGQLCIKFPMAFSSDGKKCACVTRDYNTDMTFDTIYVWDTQTGKLIKPLHGHTASIKQIAFSPICDMLASVSSDNTVRLWNTENGQQIDILQGNIDLIDSMYSMSFTPDGKNLTCLSKRAMHVLNICTNEWSILQKIPGDHLSHIINPDGSSLITGDLWGNTYVWNQYTQRLSTITNQHEQVFLLNAIQDWDNDQAHVVAPENKAIYESLIERFAFLNNPELFKTIDLGDIS